MSPSRRSSLVARAAAVLAAATLALGCVAETVRTQAHPGLLERSESIDLVAVAPFRATGGLAVQRDPRVGPAPAEATALVARQVSEALARRGVGVIPADDVARALALAAGSGERLIPLAVARQAHAEFGADAVLLGDVWRYVERSGEAAGTLRPASVGFEVTLYSAPGGQKLWSGVFDETQRALGENVLNAGRYPGGGMRWLTAEELLRWGATETAAAIPLP
jgi:hypothetical protein